MHYLSPASQKKTFVKIFITLCLSLLSSTFLFAQSTQAKMDSLIAAYVKDNKFNGVALVSQKDKIIYQKSFGYKDAIQKLPLDVNTIFQIGSLTKQFTAAVIMQLELEGKLSRTDKLEQYFPGFPNGDKITIEHLLTHTSGLYNYTNDTLWDKQDPTQHRSQKEMVEMFKKYPADFEPGKGYNYSNSGYSVLGYIVEKVSHKPYEQVVKERILQPLGMRNSGFDFTHLSSSNKAIGYFGIKEKEINPAPIVDSTIAYAAGSLYSTLGDMQKWERAIYTSKILTPASWKAVFTAHKKNYGYGWTIDSIYGKITTSHGGRIAGFSSYILRFPDEELALILFDNTSSNQLAKITRGLAAIVFNEPYDIPGPKQEIKLDEFIMKQYEGEYQIAPEFSIVISVREKRIFAQATRQEPFELFAEKENKFFLKINDATIVFVKDNNGNTTEMILSQNGRQTRGKKIK